MDVDENILKKILLPQKLVVLLFPCGVLVAIIFGRVFYYTLRLSYMM